MLQISPIYLSKDNVSLKFCLLVKLWSVLTDDQISLLLVFSLLLLFFNYFSFLAKLKPNRQDSLPSRLAVLLVLARMNKSRTHCWRAFQAFQKTQEEGLLGRTMFGVCKRAGKEDKSLFHLSQKDLLPLQRSINLFM